MKICYANSNWFSEKYEKLKLKNESINDTNSASTSCFDSIDKSNPCNEKWLRGVWRLGYLEDEGFKLK